MVIKLLFFLIDNDWFVRHWTKQNYWAIEVAHACQIQEESQRDLSAGYPVIQN